MEITSKNKAKKAIRKDYYIVDELPSEFQTEELFMMAFNICPDVIEIMPSEMVTEEVAIIAMNYNDNNEEYVPADILERIKDKLGKDELGKFSPEDKIIINKKIRGEIHMEITSKQIDYIKTVFWYYKWKNNYFGNKERLLKEINKTEIFHERYFVYEDILVMKVLVEMLDDEYEFRNKNGLSIEDNFCTPTNCEVLDHLKKYLNRNNITCDVPVVCWDAKNRREYIV